MKKLFIAVLLTLVGFAFAAPSFAIEHKFGGYWRVRMFTQKNFNGNDNANGTKVAISADDQKWTYPDSGAVKKNSKLVGKDRSIADTRTRLYYTATINDNLKFVNKFEMDATWGDSGSYGGIGADGVNVEVKNSYVDFNYGAVNAKIGTQGKVIHRGFLFDDDFSGIVLSGANVTGLYAKVKEDDTNANMNHDIAMYHLAYNVDLGNVKLSPAVTYINGEEAMALYYIALDVDATFNAVSLWGTFIYNGGEVAHTGSTQKDDVSAWLTAVGGTFNVSDTVGVHGQVFYATGDNDKTDDDADNFQGIAGQSYYWSEIMGLGIFDNQASINSPAGGISNITALNMGITVAATEKLTCSLDLWYATKDEVAAGTDEDLGIEVDLLATYQLVDGLKLDIVGAYLFADNGTTGVNVPNDENPWEVGTRLSLSF